MRHGTKQPWQQDMTRTGVLMTWTHACKANRNTHWRASSLQAINTRYVVQVKEPYEELAPSWRPRRSKRGLEGGESPALEVQAVG